LTSTVALFGVPRGRPAGFPDWPLVKARPAPRLYECLGQTAVEEEDTKNRGVAEIKADVPPARIVHGTEMLLDTADEASRKSDAPVKRRSRRF